MENGTKESPSPVSSVAESKEQNEQCRFVSEGFSNTVYCVHDAESTIGSRSGFLAIKSLNDMCFDEEKSVSRLENEYTISMHLASQCSSVRSALLLSEFDGLPAIYLEWVNGITLSKWIHSFHRKGASSPSAGNSNDRFPSIFEHEMSVILQLACDISRALSEIHCAGSIHNNFTPNNIIIDDIDGSDNYAVKVIGLGSASLLTDDSETFLKIQRDILSL
eukprot:7163531-Ditylum_brightwellii.AAC.1